MSFIFGDNHSGKTSLLMAFAFLKGLCESLLIDTISKSRKPKADQNLIRRFSLLEDSKLHKRIGNDEPMKLEFDVVISGALYRYTLEMDAGVIINESLYRKKSGDFIQIFDYDGTELTWGNRRIRAHDEEVINNLLDYHKNKYSVLSILCYLVSAQGIEKVNLNSVVLEFVLKIRYMYVDIPGFYSSNGTESFIKDIKRNPFFGILKQDRVEIFEYAMSLLNHVVSLMFPDVSHIQYRINKIGRKNVEYNLEVYFKVEHGVIEIPYENLPESLKQLFLIVGDTITSRKNRTFIIDNYCNEMSYFSLIQIIQTINPLLNIDGVFTMANYDAMNIVHPSNIFISLNDNYKFKVNHINDFFDIQSKHNIRMRFENGLIIKDRRSAKIDLGAKVISYRNKLKDFR